MSHFIKYWDNITWGVHLPTIIIVSGMAYSILAKKLTVPAACAGAVIAFIIFKAAGLTGIAMMTAFFLMASIASSFGIQRKKRFLDPQEQKNGRTLSQVLANAGVSALVGLVIIVYPQLAGLMLPVLAAAFASATADTLSSELGVLYGSRFFNVITMKPDECGSNGVVSLEGTLIGLTGSCTIALLHAFTYGFGLSFLWIVLAGTVGNLVDSVFGALFERRGLMGNDAVNFFSTLSAGLVALLFTL
ncbi:DUF92 domain-containing protein [Pedobacter jeongneungensis]|uniref:DUF92 domain-containing protein n=1 Tax=Pedobacter jeongneungensis TaxID=947309 RepID=UPI000469065F|nr:DUF92 domain-containing protein [Pedobacter jeongneungensis]